MENVMTSEQDRARRLIDRLNELSASKQVTWNQLSRCRFAVEAGGAGMVISSKDNDDVAPFVFEIIRDTGFVVTRLTSKALGEVHPSRQAVVETDNERLALLYARAKDLALGIGETLDELEREFGIVDDA
jgi:hypothetical protein